jgi:hypothetical protein
VGTSQLAAPIMVAGVVLSHPTSSTTPSMGLPRIDSSTSGAMLPMLPRRPALLGGLVAPLMWTGLIHSVLGIVNPVLNQRIDWFWFVASQVAFGVVAGIVVARQERIRTWQRLPLSVRSGMEATGMRDDNT